MLGFYLTVILAHLRARLDAVRCDEHGYTTETIVVTALLAAAALAVVGIIVAAVTNKANEIGGNL